MGDYIAHVLKLNGNLCLIRLGGKPNMSRQKSMAITQTLL